MKNPANKKTKSKKRVKKPDKIIVTSAVELKPEAVERIKKIFGEKLELQTKIDKEVIGGIRIKKTHELFDGTIQTQLNKLRDKLYNLKAYGGH